MGGRVHLTAVDLHPGQLTRLFPFYIGFDADLRCTNIGPSLQRLLPGLAVGDLLTEQFDLEQPRLPFTSEALIESQTWLLVFRCRTLDLQLRGQVVASAEDGIWLLLVSPWLREPRQLDELGLTMHDFALHDPVMDMLYMVQAQQTAFEELRVIAANLERRDVELGEAHDELELRYREVSELSAARQQFLANISHELRTPLHAIVGISELLDAGVASGQEELVTQLRTSADRLGELVDDLFSINDERSADAPITMPFSPERVARDVVGLYVARALQAGFEIRLDIDPDVPRMVIGDHIAARRVFANLLDNAVRFTDGGPVQMDVALERIGTSEYRMLVVTVRNPGPTIAPDDLTRIFEPFVQLDAARTRTRGGRGLGLAVARTTAEALCGTIDASSDATDGTTFRFAMPVQLVAAAERPRDARTADGHTVRVLIIEDDEVNQLVVTKMLQRLGCEYAVASSGADCIAMALAEPFDMVLVDLHMPNMDGIEVARVLLAERPDGPPLAALTADVLPETRVACLAAGFVDVITKPLRLAVLEQTVNELLARPHSDMT